MINLEEFRKPAQILKAMSHPVRLFILLELARKERCVCELAEMVGQDISTVSRHLSQLKNAGLVRDDKRGLQVFYRLQVPCTASFIECIKGIVDPAGGRKCSDGGFFLDGNKRRLKEEGTSLLSGRRGTGKGK